MDGGGAPCRGQGGRLDSQVLNSSQPQVFPIGIFCSMAFSDRKIFLQKPIRQTAFYNGDRNDLPGQNYV